MSKFDLAVIGSGPAGYVAAIRAAQLGMKVALIEKYSTLGGTCLNVGCIPSKALLDSSEKFEQLHHHYEAHGITAKDVKVDVNKMVERKQGVVSQLTAGVAMLMKKNKITVVQGFASFKDKNTLDIDGGKSTVEADKIIIAAGSKPVELPFAKYDGNVIVSSTEALEFNKVPKHLIVIGAGVIGLEMGSVWGRLGAEVTLVDIAERPLMVMDSELGKEAQKQFAKQGLKFMMGAAVEDVKTTKSGATVTVKDAKGELHTLKGDKVLVSVGRRSYTEGLGLDKVGVQVDGRGVISVNEQYQTNVPNIYAIGDCTPGPMLAHKGEEEGVACVEMMAGQKPHVNYNCIPWVVYTSPEIAGVGLSEEQCKEQGIAYKSGKFKYIANGRAIAIGETGGFVKIIADAKTDKVLGMHVIGHNASEMIHEGVIAMEFGGSAEDIARSVHAHPTMSEATKEAALAVDKRALHS